MTTAKAIGLSLDAVLIIGSLSCREIITIGGRVINGTSALRSERRTHAILAIFKISPLVPLSSLRHTFLALSSYVRTYPFFPLEPRVSFFATPSFGDPFWGFVLRYYQPRLSRFLAPRNSGHPLWEPLFLRTTREPIVPFARMDIAAFHRVTRR